MGVGDQRHAPAALPPGKARYPLCRGLGGTQGRYGRAQKTGCTVHRMTSGKVLMNNEIGFG
jgi:hypothetical protein